MLRYQAAENSVITSGAAKKGLFSSRDNCNCWILKQFERKSYFLGIQAWVLRQNGKQKKLCAKEWLKRHIFLSHFFIFHHKPKRMLKSSCLRALRISRQRLFWHIAHILPQDTLWWTVFKNHDFKFQRFFIFEKNSKVWKCGQSAFSAQWNAPNNTERRSFRKALKFNQLLLNFTQV